MPKFYDVMKTILLLLTVFFTSLAVSSCTNDEGEDLDVLTPNDDEELLIEESLKTDNDQ